MHVCIHVWMHVRIYVCMHVWHCFYSSLIRIVQMFLVGLDQACFVVQLVWELISVGILIEFKNMYDMYVCVYRWIDGLIHGLMDVLIYIYSPCVCMDITIDGFVNILCLYILMGSLFDWWVDEWMHGLLDRLMYVLYIYIYVYIYVYIYIHVPASCVHGSCVAIIPPLPPSCVPRALPPGTAHTRAG